MANKKIINASPLSYNGIEFKSKLECLVYRTLMEEGITPEYEQRSFIIFRGFTPTVPFYTKNTFKRKNCNITKVSTATVIDWRKVKDWVYTPDFYFRYKDYTIFIEVKGYYNDIARYKSKLFRWQIDCRQKKDLSRKYEFWEIHTKKQLLDCISHIKTPST